MFEQIAVKGGTKSFKTALVSGTTVNMVNRQESFVAFFAACAFISAIRCKNEILYFRETPTHGSASLFSIGSIVLSRVSNSLFSNLASVVSFLLCKDGFSIFAVPILLQFFVSVRISLLPQSYTFANLRSTLFSFRDAQQLHA